MDSLAIDSTNTGNILRIYQIQNTLTDKTFPNVARLILANITGDLITTIQLDLCGTVGWNTYVKRWTAIIKGDIERELETGGDFNVLRQRRDNIRTELVGAIGSSKEDDLVDVGQLKLFQQVGSVEIVSIVPTIPQTTEMRIICGALSEVLAVFIGSHSQERNEIFNTLVRVLNSCPYEPVFHVLVAALQQLDAIVIK
jgi:hypothetical protein